MLVLNRVGQIDAEGRSDKDSGSLVEILLRYADLATRKEGATVIDADAVNGEASDTLRTALHVIYTRFQQIADGSGTYVRNGVAIDEPPELFRSPPVGFDPQSPDVVVRGLVIVQPATDTWVRAGC